MSEAASSMFYSLMLLGMVAAICLGMTQCFNVRVCHDNCETPTVGPLTCECK